MKPVRLPARWTGDLPTPGQFICSGPRARYAYEITAVRRIDPRKNKRRYNVALMCVRWSPHDVPPGATVYSWRWDKR